MKLKELLEKRSQLQQEIRGLIDTDFKKAQEKYKELEDLNADIQKLEQQEEMRKALGGDKGDRDGDGDNEPEQRRANPKAPHVDLGVKEHSEEYREFEAYLKGEKRDIQGGSLKTDSGFVVIPEEIVTDILKLKEMEFNLDQYVTVKPVENGSGKYPVVRQSQVAALPEVEELAENPELAVKPFFQLAYDIKTHRGYFLISREAIEDSKIDVIAELKQWMARTVAATRNAAIINVLKNGGPGEDGPTTKIPAVTATSIDDIKDAVNLRILPNYEHNVAIVSQSAFATIDKLKDNQGNYLVQPDVKEASAKRLLGARVVILPDEMLGADGANTLVLGNLKDAITLFTRSQYEAQWKDYMHFGEGLMVAVRQDARLLDHKAAVVITLDITVPEAPAEV
jgi:HK97 family phage major capsid protein